jgi:predicted metal-binding protein
MENGKGVKEKVAVLRCDIVSEVCPGSGCLKAWNGRRVHFADTSADAEMIGFFTCGGCSGRRVSRLIKTLLKSKLTTVHLSSCMLMEGDYPKCPHLNDIKKTIEKLGVRIIEGTHH